MSEEFIVVLGDEFFMREAISLARGAECLGEVPVGAVVVRDGGSSVVVSIRLLARVTRPRMRKSLPCAMRRATWVTTGCQAASCS
jgi:pyrimidine deaminase RibD-like protein